MCESRGIKVIAALIFVGLFAFGLSANSYAQNTFGQVLGTQQWKTFSNPNGVGGEWGKSSAWERDSDSQKSVEKACREKSSAGRDADKGC